MHTKSGEEFVVHVNKLSAIRKELKESGQTVESTRKRPFTLKVRENITVPERHTRMTKYPLRDQEPSMEAMELESENDEILADNEPVLGPKQAPGKKWDREKEGDGEQSGVLENSPPQSHKILDAAHLGPELISSQMRSKVCEAKAVQTEPTTISISTNTSSVSYSSAPDAVLEFPEYRKTGTTDFTWSQSLELKNQRFVIYAQKYRAKIGGIKRERKSLILLNAWWRVLCLLSALR